MELVKKIAKTYENELMRVADIINGISAFVPNKRARKLHVGLFGYSRSVKGMKLPRAIKFCAAFYSIGIPPELLGLSALSEKEFEELHTHYSSIDEDLKDSAKYINQENLEKMPSEFKKGISKVLEWIDYEEDEEYSAITSRIYNNYISNKHNLIAEDVKSTAWKRKFLG
jgi:phosphoenolpyruvate carboxylase